MDLSLERWEGATSAGREEIARQLAMQLPTGFAFESIRDHQLGKHRHSVAFYQFRQASFALIPWIVPSIFVGVPLGAMIIQRVRPETFRRICMSFDAWVVAFGLSRLLGELKLVESGAAYLVLVGVALLDTWMLYRFFSGPIVTAPVYNGPERPLPGDRLTL